MAFSGLIGRALGTLPPTSQTWNGSYSSDSPDLFYMILDGMRHPRILDSDLAGTGRQGTEG